jgi:Circularly permutated YpsA SLOG family
MSEPTSTLSGSVTIPVAGDVIGRSYSLVRHRLDRSATRRQADEPAACRKGRSARIPRSAGRRQVSPNTTLKVCRSTGMPHPFIDLADERNQAAAVYGFRDWLVANLPGGILHVTGLRASEHPAVYDRARVFLRALLAEAER